MLPAAASCRCCVLLPLLLLLLLCRTRLRLGMGSKFTETAYATLGMERSSFTTEKLRRQYRLLALRWHPDRNRGNEAAAAEQFRRLQDAYEILVDTNRRRFYDLELERGGAVAERDRVVGRIRHLKHEAATARRDASRAGDDAARREEAARAASTEAVSARTKAEAALATSEAAEDAAEAKLEAVLRGLEQVEPGSSGVKAE